jgi:hypothetical protein
MLLRVFWGHLVAEMAEMAGHGNCSAFCLMLKVPVTSALTNLMPGIGLYRLDNVPHLHDPQRSPRRQLSKE